MLIKYDEQNYVVYFHYHYTYTHTHTHKHTYTHGLFYCTCLCVPGSTSGRVGMSTARSTLTAPAGTVRQSGKSGTAAESWTSTAAS